MKQFTQLAILHVATCLGLTCTLSCQILKLDSIRYDGFGGLHSSSNLTTWEELRGTGLQRFRIIGAYGSRTQVEVDVLIRH